MQQDHQQPPQSPPPSVAKPAWTPAGSPRSFHKTAAALTTLRGRDHLEEKHATDSETSETPRSSHERSSPRSPVHRSSPRSPGHRSSPRVQFRDGGRASQRPAGGGGGVEQQHQTGLDTEMVEREIARQVWLDNEVTRRVRGVLNCIQLKGEWAQGKALKFERCDECVCIKRCRRKV